MILCKICFSPKAQQTQAQTYSLKWVSNFSRMLTARFTVFEEGVVSG